MLDCETGDRTKSLFNNSVNSADSDAGDSSQQTPNFFKRNSLQSRNGMKFSECVTLDAVKEVNEHSDDYGSLGYESSE